MYNIPLFIGAVFVICLTGRMDKEHAQNDEQETHRLPKTSESVYRDYVETVGGSWHE